MEIYFVSIRLWKFFFTRTRRLLLILSHAEIDEADFLD